MNKAEFTKSRKNFAAKTIEQLIELLESEDLPTRFFAEMNLRDATST